MLVTLLGIVMLSRLEQLSKAESPMLVTPSGSVMLLTLVQLEKAEAPMPVTLFPLISDGIKMLVFIPAYPVISAVPSSRIL